RHVGRPGSRERDAHHRVRSDPQAVAVRDVEVFAPNALLGILAVDLRILAGGQQRRQKDQRGGRALHSTESCASAVTSAGISMSRALGALVVRSFHRCPFATQICRRSLVARPSRYTMNVSTRTGVLAGLVGASHVRLSVWRE